MRIHCLALLLAAAPAACNVSDAARSTGGVQLPDGSPMGMTDAGGDADAGGTGAQCPRAISVGSTDYASTNVSIVSPRGAVLSESIISSGSASPGVTTALSGDVVFPSTVNRSGKLTLIDRYPNSVVTWLDVETGSVVRQLSVSTGFASNPHDYIEVSDHKAYVSRYESNPVPGKEPLDGGGDALVIDLGDYSITGRIPLASPGDGTYLPRPDRMLAVGSEVWILLGRLDADFKPAGASRLVGIDPTSDSVAWTLDLPDAANCGGMVLSPSGARVAVSCSGNLSDPTSSDGRALVLVDAKSDPPVEIRRFPEAASLGAPIGPSLSFATENLVLGVAYGDAAGGRNDVAFSIDVATAEVKTVVDAGAAFALGDVLCSPGCADICMLADARSKTVRTFEVTGDTLAEGRSFQVDPTIGLPPRSLGAL